MEVGRTRSAWHDQAFQQGDGRGDCRKPSIVEAVEDFVHDRGKCRIPLHEVDDRAVSGKRRPTWDNASATFTASAPGPRLAPRLTRSSRARPMPGRPRRRADGPHRPRISCQERRSSSADASPACGQAVDDPLDQAQLFRRAQLRCERGQVFPGNAVGHDSTLSSSFNTPPHRNTTTGVCRFASKRRRPTHPHSGDCRGLEPARGSATAPARAGPAPWPCRPSAAGGPRRDSTRCPRTRRPRRHPSGRPGP